jgi:hypothetical protein
VSRAGELLQAQDRVPVCVRVWSFWLLSCSLRGGDVASVVERPQSGAVFQEMLLGCYQHTLVGVAGDQRDLFKAGNCQIWTTPGAWARWVACFGLSMHDMAPCLGAAWNTFLLTHSRDEDMTTGRSGSPRTRLDQLLHA